MKNIRNAKSETSHSVTDRIALRILLYEVSDFVHSMFFKVLNFELT